MKRVRPSSGVCLVSDIGDEVDNGKSNMRSVVRKILAFDFQMFQISRPVQVKTCRFHNALDG